MMRDSFGATPEGWSRYTFAIENPKGSTLYSSRFEEIEKLKVADRDIPIVHRVIKVHEKETGEVDLLTKGDNNAVDDHVARRAGAGPRWRTRGTEAIAPRAHPPRGSRGRGSAGLRTSSC